MVAWRGAGKAGGRRQSERSQSDSHSLTHSASSAQQPVVGETRKSSGRRSGKNTHAHTRRRRDDAQWPTSNDLDMIACLRTVPISNSATHIHLRAWLRRGGTAYTTLFYSCSSSRKPQPAGLGTLYKSRRLSAQQPRIPSISTSSSSLQHLFNRSHPPSSTTYTQLHSQPPSILLDHHACS